MAQIGHIGEISEIGTEEPYASIIFPQANLFLPLLVHTAATYSSMNVKFSHFASLQVVDILCQPSEGVQNKSPQNVPL